MKTTKCEVKNILNEIHGKLDITKEKKIGELENRNRNNSQ